MCRGSTPRPPPGLINYPSYISPRTPGRPSISTPAPPRVRARGPSSPLLLLLTLALRLLRLPRYHRRAAPIELPPRRYAFLFTYVRTYRTCVRDMSYRTSVQSPIVEPSAPQRTTHLLARSHSLFFPPFSAFSFRYDYTRVREKLRSTLGKREIYRFFTVFCRTRA